MTKQLRDQRASMILRELGRRKESEMSAKDIFSQYEPVFLRHAAFALGVLDLVVVQEPVQVPRTVNDIAKSASEVRPFRCVNCDARFYRLKHSDGLASQDIRRGLTNTFSRDRRTNTDHLTWAVMATLSFAFTFRVYRDV